MTQLNPKYALCLVLFLTFIGCTSDPEPEKPKPAPISLKLLAPNHQQQYTIGEVINVNIQVLHPENVVDLTLKINDTVYSENIKPETQTIKIPTDSARVGWNTIFLTYKDENGRLKGSTRNVILFSDTAPEEKSATIINSFPHNPDSYTQGLEFYNGRLYESTGSGDNSQSFIAEIGLIGGNIIRKVDLDNRYFGEGMTILNDTIYQITWRGQKCFMYNMAFEKIGEFDYDGEGWGLCNNGKSIIMTDGTSKVVWRNPRTFEIEKEIYAFTDQTDIVALNEIELINGNLFCNVYTKNYIVEMDTATGKVLTTIDCSALVEKGKTQFADVLNGIVYDKVNQKTYMTGKLWPLLFEVEFE